MKRVKADSWSAALTSGQREELMSAYHHSALSCADAAEQASEWTGREVTVSMFSAWYHGQRFGWLAEQAHRKSEEEAAKAPEDLDARKSLAIRQAAFAAALDDLSAADIASLERNELTRRKLELEERRLALDEAKFEDAKRKAATLDEAAKEIKQTGGLSPESLKKIEEASKLL
jgi:hypothetical protein